MPSLPSLIANRLQTYINSPSHPQVLTSFSFFFTLPSNTTTNQPTSLLYQQPTTHNNHGQGYSIHCRVQRAHCFGQEGHCRLPCHLVRVCITFLTKLIIFFCAAQCRVIYIYIFVYSGLLFDGYDYKHSNGRSEDQETQQDPRRRRRKKKEDQQRGINFSSLDGSHQPCLLTTTETTNIFFFFCWCLTLITFSVFHTTRVGIKRERRVKKKKNLMERKKKKAKFVSQIAHTLPSFADPRTYIGYSIISSSLKTRGERATKKDNGRKRV